MSLVEIVSVIFGVCGLAFGAYSYIALRRSRKRKKNLTELAGKLRDIHSRASHIVEGYQSPLTNVDNRSSLDNISKSLLAFNYETDQSPRPAAEIYRDDEYIHNGD